jgi:DGQHR domain-containing protein
MAPRVLRLPAIEIRQGRSRVLYSLAVDGKILHQFATVSRLRRDSDHELGGYQRPEVLAHIKQIKTYLESEDPLLPNAIVIAFDDRVTFEPADVQPVGQGFTRVGNLAVPIDESLADEEKPGWIVDGQQRSAAIREANLVEFPICVTAFIAEDEREQREQFILVNSTKPLPKGLIYELLPQTDATLPTLLRRRRFPAYLLQRLNFDEDSPLKRLIRTPTNPEGLIKDNSVLKMLEHSLSEGALHDYRDPYTGEGDVVSMLILLKRYWAAVAKVFEAAWGLPPHQSRLTHGVGIVSMGFLMDAISDAFQSIPSQSEFEQYLSPMANYCHWTGGYWEMGAGVRRKWSELENTARDIQLVSDYLLTAYREVVWDTIAKNAIAG